MAANRGDKFKFTIGGAGLLIVLLALASVLMLAWCLEGAGWSITRNAAHVVSSIGSKAASPLRYAGAYVASGTQKLSSFMSDVLATDDDRSAVLSQNAELAERVAALLAYEDIDQAYLSELDLIDAYTSVSVSACVVGLSDDALNHAITIDAGSASGVHEGCAVMASGGVVGTVSAVRENSSDVLLIQDSNCAEHDMVQSTRVEGVL